MVTLIKEIIMAEGTKERILRTALELFAHTCPVKDRVVS